MSVLVSGVSKLYGTQRALDDISFEVKRGEVIGFLGPNGAGKSTMMKIITCFIPPTNGDVQVCGFDVRSQSMEIKKRVGYLPEHNPVYTDMYVKEYLQYVAQIHRKNQDMNVRVANMVELTGLGPEQHKKIGQLSKGYRQRVGLAQAMIHGPEVLILDEPTSGLDPNQLVDIRNLIKDIGKEKTVILSTHIMQEVEAICSRVIIINKGKIVADDATDVITKKSGGVQVIVVGFAEEVSIDLIRALPGVTHVIKMEGNQFRIQANSQDDVRTSLFQFAVQHRLTIHTLQQQEQKLEEVFRELTN